MAAEATPAIVVAVERHNATTLRQALRLMVVGSSVAHLRARRKRKDWTPVAIRPELKDASIVLAMVIKNELSRLPHLLSYYRRLGVDHFLVIDNASTDATPAFLQTEEDVSVVLATGAYGESRYGVDWLNGVLKRFCVGKWVLWVDADEMFVFSDDADVTLPHLTARLEELKVSSLQAIMLDMYSERPAHENTLDVGQDPLEVCPLFDGSGYQQTFCRDNHTGWIKGGVRQRLFFAEASSAPALNKTPLVRWRRRFVYLKSAHQLWPQRINGRTRLGAALLHFKFTNVAAEKMVDPENRAQHTTEYDAYGSVNQLSMVGPPTVAYQSAGQLAHLGLIEPYV